MKKEVIIEVNSVQTIDENADKLDLSVVGTLEFGDNCYTIRYIEYDGEMKGCKTVITVTGGDTVSIIRGGGYTTELLLQRGKRHSSLYSTPYGEFTIGIYTSKILSDMSENGGTLETAYSIDFSSGTAAENSMKITVSEGKNQNVENS